MAMPAKRRQQRGPRRMPAQPVADKRPDALEDGTGKTGEQAGLPGEVRVFRLEIDRGDDQEDEGDETDGIDAVGQGGDIGPAGPDGQPSCLPRIEGIAEEDRQGRAGKDPAVNEFRRHAANIAAKNRDQHQLQKIVDEQPEESVNISANKPPCLHQATPPSISSKVLQQRGGDADFLRAD